MLATVSAELNHASPVKEGGPVGAFTASPCCISARALAGTTSGSLTSSFDRACTWKLPSSIPGMNTTMLPTWSSLLATDVSHQVWWMAASCANCSVCSGPSTRALFSLTDCMVLIKVGPEMCETVSQVPGTDVLEHFKSILLFESLNRNSTRSASLPTASAVDLEQHRSSNRDRAESPATTEPRGPTEYVRPPHSKLRTDTL